MKKKMPADKTQHRLKPKHFDLKGKRFLNSSRVYWPWACA